MTHADQVRNMAVQAAAYAVSTAGNATDAQICLRHTMGPFMPALRLVAAQEHAAEINSFVNPARVEIEVSVVTRDGFEMSTGGENGT